jgi:hypothetical protein
MKKLLVILLLLFVVSCDGDVKKSQKSNLKDWEGFELISTTEDHSVIFINKKTKQAKLCYVSDFDRDDFDYKCVTTYIEGY